MFIIRAKLPAVESFTLSGELRHEASGDVHYHAKFAGFEVIPEDPFCEYALTPEELADEGEVLGAQVLSARARNVPRKILTSIRKRKGLPIDERVVKNAEKQRTMTRMK